MLKFGTLYDMKRTNEQAESQQQNTSQLFEWISQLQLPISELYELIMLSDVVVSIESLYDML